MVLFLNHPPINLSSAHLLCEVKRPERDQNSEPGKNCRGYTLFQGIRLHLVHFLFEVAESEVRDCAQYLGRFNTRADVVAHLVTRPNDDRWWADALLEQLGYAGEPA